MAVPFGERETAGVIWSLDASDDTGDLSEGDEAGDSDEDNIYSLRAISSLLLDEPALSPVQRALAEWMATYYAAPLATTVRPMLPPGLVRGIRYTLRPTGAEPPEDLPPDAAMLLAMLHERRAVEREQVSEALGMTRARRAIRALLRCRPGRRRAGGSHRLRTSVAASDWYVSSPRTTPHPLA